MYLSTIPWLPRRASAVTHAKKVFTKTSVSVGVRWIVRFEKFDISANRMVASISRPFTGNIAPHPLSSWPSTLESEEIRKSSRERYGYLTVTTCSVRRVFERNRRSQRSMDFVQCIACRLPLEPRHVPYAGPAAHRPHRSAGPVPPRSSICLSDSIHQSGGKAPSTITVLYEVRKSWGPSRPPAKSWRSLRPTLLPRRIRSPEVSRIGPLEIVNDPDGSTAFLTFVVIEKSCVGGVKSRKSPED